MIQCKASVPNLTLRVPRPELYSRGPFEQMEMYKMLSLPYLGALGCSPLSPKRNPPLYSIITDNIEPYSNNIVEKTLLATWQHRFNLIRIHYNSLANTIGIYNIPKYIYTGIIIVPTANRNLLF